MKSQTISTGCAGQTFLTLTTDADSFPGTAGNDTLNATDTTFTTGDSLNGGAGTDTLTVLFGDDSVTPIVDTNSIEKISLRNADAAALTLNASSWDGVTTLETLRSTNDVVLTGVQANATLSMNRMTDNVDFNVTFADDAVGSATGTLSVAANDSDANLLVTTGGDDVFTTLSVAVASDSVIALTLNDDAGNDDTLTTINVTGAGALELTETTTEFVNLTTITVADGGLTINTDTNAEDVTVTAGNGDNSLTIDGGGDVTITAGNGDNTIEVGAGDDTITTGSGDDTITIGAGDDTVNSGRGDDVIILAGNLDANDSINGGVGTDTISLTSAGAAAAEADEDVLAILSNFETLAISNVLADDVDLTTWGFSRLSLEVGAAAAGTVTMASGNTIAFDQAVAVAADVTSGAIIASVSGSSGAGASSDVVNLAINADFDEAANDTFTVDLSVDFVETLNITAVATDVAGDDDGVMDNGNFVVSVEDGDRLSSITINTNLAATVSEDTTSFTALNVFDASASSGGVTVDLSNTTQGVTMTGGSGADVITDSAFADEVNLGSGADIFNYTNGGADEVDLGAADGDVDQVEIDAFTATMGFTVSNFENDIDLLDVTDADVDNAVNTISDVLTTAAVLGDNDITVIEQTVGAAGSLLDGSTLTITDFTDITEVEAFLDEAFSVSASDEALILLNDGTNSYLYRFLEADTATTIDADEITLVGTFTGTVLAAVDVQVTT